MSPLLSGGWHCLSGRARHLFLLILSHPNRRGQVLREWPEGLACDLNTRPGLVRKALIELQGGGFLMCDGPLITIREFPCEAPAGFADGPGLATGLSELEPVQALGKAVLNICGMAGGMAGSTAEGRGFMEAIRTAVAMLAGCGNSDAKHALDNDTVRASCGDNLHPLSSLIKFFIDLLSSSSGLGPEKAAPGFSSSVACTRASCENRRPDNSTGNVSCNGSVSGSGNDSLYESGLCSGDVSRETSGNVSGIESGCCSGNVSCNSTGNGSCSGSVSGSANVSCNGSERESGMDAGPVSHRMPEPEKDGIQHWKPCPAPVLSDEMGFTGKEEAFEPWIYGGRPFSLPSRAGEQLLSREAVEELKRMYPNVVMETEIPRIAQYLRNNPHKRPVHGLCAMTWLLSNFINKKLERQSGAGTRRRGPHVRTLFERLLDELMEGFGNSREAAL